MLFVVAVLTQSLKVIEPESYRRVAIVLFCQISLMMNNSRRFIYPLGFASLTKMIDLLEISFPASLPFG
jgi:hypothetical protein